MASKPKVSKAQVPDEDKIRREGLYSALVEQQRRSVGGHASTLLGAEQFSPTLLASVPKGILESSKERDAREKDEARDLMVRKKRGDAGDGVRSTTLGGGGHYDGAAYF